ncbi:alpha/beta fold hydrolase [Viridibacillus soli]|uniref:alpha/beta fold hydrolase n=1 Tax=Viridibacillus soli TaxID=2798301 RepID=UPI001F389877|nr:alpha/beta hydrolase [Viridibacillus soli]
MTVIKANNIHINYEIRGDGEPILFLHGLGGSWKMWEPQIPFFSQKYKMIMIDMRGHGGSTKAFPNDRFDPRVMAEDIKFFLDAMGIIKISIVGVSQGSVVAQLFAAKYSSYINKLVLSNGYSEVPTKLSGFVLKISTAIFKMLSYETIINAMLKVYKNDNYTKKS